MSTRIIVGYDGSASSAGAADWAALEASARDVPLTLVACHSSQPSLGPAEVKAEELRRRFPTVVCEVEARLGSPKEALIAASADAALLVVGKTGAGLAKLLIGSVATAVIRHSHCPAIVVPPPVETRPRTGVIVVGVDGSPEAASALDWAIDEAAIHGDEVRIVHAWSYVYTGPAVESTERHAAACDAARRTLDGIVKDALARAHGLVVSGRLVEGSPTWALLEEAASADSLVVGSRGLGGLRSMLVGSVATAVTEQARCPTAVIRRPAIR